MALVEQREQLEGGNVAIRLPGVRKGDMSSRRFQPEVRVFSVRFSPTGQAFAAAGTEGLCIYALDKGKLANRQTIIFSLQTNLKLKWLSQVSFSIHLTCRWKLLLKRPTRH